MDQRFIAAFIVVTGALAAAIQLTGRAVADGGTVVTVLAALAGSFAVLGSIALVRVVVIVERERRRR